MSLKSIVEPFADAAVECFTTMLNATPYLQDVLFDTPTVKETHIASIIGLSGDAKGIISISFSTETALNVAGRFLGENFVEMNDEVTDAIGEMANIIAGAAKAKIQGLKLAISLPSIMRGEKLLVEFPKGTPTLTIIFDVTGVGEVIIVVALKLNLD